LGYIGDFMENLWPKADIIEKELGWTLSTKFLEKLHHETGICDEYIETVLLAASEYLKNRNQYNFYTSESKQQKSHHSKT
jgi:hypothetical protein